MARTRSAIVVQTSELAAELRPRILRRLASSRGPRGLRKLVAAVGLATDSHLSDDAFAALYAESVACGAAAVALARPVFDDPHVRAWALAHANPLWKEIIRESLALAAERELDASPAAAGRDNSILAFYESFLRHQDRRRRTRHGVFYTPPPIARYIVSQAHRALVDEFGIRDGLADEATWDDVARRMKSLALPAGATSETPFVRVLDPALGTGVFFDEGLRLACAQASVRWPARDASPPPADRAWDEYVARRLLPRWFGLELMLPACVVATVKLVATLAELGFSFTAATRLEIHLANTLAGPITSSDAMPAASDNAFWPAAIAGRNLACRTPFSVIVGNPPFSGLSTHQGRWIADLLRGRDQLGGRWCNYFEIDARPLGERKTWLQDDYVKFLRFAHWRIEATGCGIVGLVTNHGYLDNPTFRGVRHQLLTTFPRITVIDLHGNRKKRECAPDGRRDENVFGIAPGTAIGLFRRPPSADRPPIVRHAELWGDADDKLRALEVIGGNTIGGAARPSEGGARRALRFRAITPTSSQYFFCPRPRAEAAEYAAAPRLPDLMPIHTTAPVTARDHFVVAFTRDELLARMADFRDPTIADAELRARYFRNTRSPTYPAGDTRGWKLDQARRRMAADPRWREHVRPCWYRPFDERFVYWSDAMVDWPRNKVMPCLLRPGNLALVARRQMLPSQACNYFWIVDQLLLDGLIRSDNRGSESVFPLWISAEHGAAPPRDRVNLDEPFLERAARQLGIRWQLDGPRSDDAFCARDMLHYMYALLFSPGYRLRYADRLWSDFPRVLLPRRTKLFRELAAVGGQLADLHLLRGLRLAAATPESHPRAVQAAGPLSSDAASAGAALSQWSIDQAPIVQAGFPKYASQRVSINRAVWLDPVPDAIWTYRVGGHQVCAKWLKDRRGRMLTDRDLMVYQAIVSALGGTWRAEIEIEAAIEDAGGWPAAFSTLDG